MECRKRCITIFALIFTGVFLLMQIMRSSELLNSEGSYYSLNYVEESILEKQKKDYNELREDYLKLREDITRYQKFNLDSFEDLESQIINIEDNLNDVEDQLSQLQDRGSTDE